MKVKHVSLLFLVVCICIPMVCSAAEICPEGEDSPECATGSYSWDGTTVTIIEPGEYTFAANIPSGISIEVTSSEVTLDGNGVTLHQILGQPDLDLTNITISIDEPDFSGSAITECRNIVNSSIAVTSEHWMYGIGSLYGTIDDTTSITITNIASQESQAAGVYEVYGTISGGTFSVAIQNGYAAGVETLYGTISGGTFTVTSEGLWAYGVTFIMDNGAISGGEFTVTGTNWGASGVANVYDSGTVSGGEFTVTGDIYANGVYTVNNNGIVSGGTFTVTKVREAYAAGVERVTDNGIVSGGTFTVTGQTSSAFEVYEIMDNGEVSGGEFTVTEK